jgi:hypothetical protein
MDLPYNASGVGEAGLSELDLPCSMVPAGLSALASSTAPAGLSASSTALPKPADLGAAVVQAVKAMLEDAGGDGKNVERQ